MSNKRDKHSDKPTRRQKKERPADREGSSTIIVLGDTEWDDEAATKEIMGNQRGTGRTYQPQKAVEEGLSYTPPRDPATVPSEDDGQGSEMAAGFAPSMEEADPDAQILPDRIDRADLEIQEDVGLALRYNSETSQRTFTPEHPDRCLSGIAVCIGQVTGRHAGSCDQPHSRQPVRE